MTRPSRDQERRYEVSMQMLAWEARETLRRLTPIPSPQQKARAEMLAEWHKARRWELEKTRFFERMRERGEL